MKYSVIFFPLICILWLLSAASCTDTDDERQSSGAATEGELTLDFEHMPDPEIHISRAGKEAPGHGRLYSLRVYVFGEDGTLQGYTYLTKLEGHQIPTKGKVTVKARSGKSYIYAIANLRTSQYNVSSGDYSILDVDPRRVSESTLTRERFLKVRFQRQREGLQPLDGLFLMSGHAHSGLPVTLTPSGQGRLTITDPVAPADRTIRLYSILASNRIVIKTPAEGGHEFMLTRYELCNVPLSGTLMPTAGPSPSTTGDFEQMPVKQVTSGNEIEFLLPENIQYVSPGTQITQWEDREKNTYDADYLQQTFTHAPAQASYIRLYGRYRNLGDKISADVVYTIHFGDIGSRLERLDNFQVSRNSRYVYTVTVQGVHDIIVEAQKQGDHPYAEGNIIHVTDGEVIELDAHYESRILKFIQGASSITGKKHPRVEDLARAKFHGYMTYVSTPMGRSRALCVEKSEQDQKVYVYDTFAPGAKKPLCEIRSDGHFYHPVTGVHITSDAELTALLGTTDYKWVKFRKNTAANLSVSGGQLDRWVCKYPGDQFFMKSSADMDPALTGDREPLVNIFMVLYSLVVHEHDRSDYWNSVTADGTPCVYYTAFVDENYYEGESWDRYVNTPDRSMNVASRIHVSEDQHSVYTDVLYNLSQRAIRTFYNPAFASTVAAFGIETIEEELHTPEAPADTVQFWNGNFDFPPSNRHQWDGHTMASLMLNNYLWENLSIKKVAYMQPLYKSVSKSVLTRNRDLNGNGLVDDDEVRWYVGAEGQYAGAWFGEDIFPLETRLFDINLIHNLPEGNGEIIHQCHYFACSPQNIFWAEEGSSTSRVEDPLWSQARKVRCFRTLESHGPGLRNPDRYYEPQYLDNREVIVDLRRMDHRALRGNVDRNFAVHYERDEQNKLPHRLKIAKGLATFRNDPNTYRFTKEQVKDEADPGLLMNTGYPGETGWRLPNQVELGLMAIVNSSLYVDLWCRTKFNGQRYGKGNRPYKPNATGYGRLPNGNITVGVASRKLNVRCVKDLP